MTYREITEIALRQCAADCSCAPEDFLRDTDVVFESKPDENGSRYMDLPHICAMFTWGSNVVVSCRKDLIPDMEDYISSNAPLYRCFDVPGIYRLNRILEKAGAETAWMHSFFLPDPDRIFSTDLSCPYEIRILHPEDFTGLYRPEWRNALCEKRKELDMLGAGAYDGETLVGLAGCSADCPDMWQIGIDVLPEYRRKGIASALTNRLAREIFGQGKVPFYAAAWANVKSVKNAARSGFRPAWAVITAKEKESE